ncbi:chitin synthase export chaperone [[Candida] railenensis]|uniref:Chitin synthase export chaperone n=1 Tax=[Candida] railenensis TaxID=45579 RepID=A0A9P0QN45_9ASCO|nr:chitin synthase export chaperone [[Candida] railenensis]
MSFGSFDHVCNKTAFPICNVIQSLSNSTDFSRGVIPVCYSRSVELANTMIFQIGNAFVHFGSLIVLLIIIFHVRAKYTAIGRTEMLQFFYLCICLVISSLVVDCGVASPSSSTYAYFVALQFGFTSAVCACIFYNGLLCFQFWEDGSRKSRFLLRIISFAWFACNYIISIITFKSWGTLLNDGSTEVLFVVSYIGNALLLAAYFVSQIILVIFALDSYWPLGAIFLSAFFFVTGQVLAYVFSENICEGLSHYIDGIFFGSLCNIFAIMMIYKFWDMITTDDLEFSVANVEHGINAFEDEDEKRNTIYSYR